MARGKTPGKRLSQGLKFGGESFAGTTLAPLPNLRRSPGEKDSEHENTGKGNEAVEQRGEPALVSFLHPPGRQTHRCSNQKLVKKAAKQRAEKLGKPIRHESSVSLKTWPECLPIIQPPLMLPHLSHLYAYLSATPKIIV